MLPILHNTNLSIGTEVIYPHEFERTLSIDIETYSDVNLKTCGVYKYAASDDFKVILFCYAYDDEPVQAIDLTKQKLPTQLVRDIKSRKIKKTAYNAAFEIVCLSCELGEWLDPRQWECTLVKCGMLGLPMNLADVSRVLNLSSAKYSTGMALIRYFCIPCKPTATNGYRTRNLPEHAPEKWAEFIEYGMQDVRAEKEALQKVKWFTIPEREREFWILDQKINRFGVRVDIKLIESAIKINAEYQEILLKEAVDITGLENPKSVQQIKKWLQKESVEEGEDEAFDPTIALKQADLPKFIKKFGAPQIKRVLEIRQQISKTSIKKYHAMLNAVGADGRVRGTTQYYGANRTGRFAGRIIQPQNYPRNEIKDLAIARAAVKTGCTELISALWDSPPYILSQILRTAFIPGPGKEFIPDDYASIEAKVLAWLSGEQWQLDVFKGDGRIYEATAANMFNIPIETIDKKSPYRQRGKIAALALGYGGAKGALIQMRAVEQGIPETELDAIVDLYRAANPNIVDYWEYLRKSFITALLYGTHVSLTHGMGMQYMRGCMFITLPSGRQLVYCNPNLGDGGITYWGMNQTKKTWEMIRTYGGKLAENITQAIARDILREGMLNLDRHGYAIALHIHDEVIVEHKVNDVEVEVIDSLMCPVIAWAKGLPLSAEGFKTRYYKKDDK